MICFMSLPMSSAWEGHHFRSRAVSSITPALNGGVFTIVFEVLLRFLWSRRLGTSFQCTGCHFSSGPQKRGVVLLFKAIFTNNKIVVYLLVVE